MQTRNAISWIKEEITRSISVSLIIYILIRAPISDAYPIFAQQGYENPREATGRIVCANCHLANKPVDIEVPQTVLPDTVFEAVVRIPYDMQMSYCSIRLIFSYTYILIYNCIESYLRSQICIVSHILGESDKYNDSYFYTSICGKGGNSSESEGSSIKTTITNENLTKREDSKDLDETQKYKHLWIECENCYGLNYRKFFKSKMNICEHCGYHLKMSSSDRIELSIDLGTWNPMDEDMVSMDPIEFHSEEESESYKNRMDSYQRKTGLTEAVQTGTGQLNGIPVAIGIMDFQFMGGSMGSVVGEKITRLVEHAGNQLLPLILVCASGGARMQEGSLSLIQMAKISSALYEYQKNKRLFYVSILTSLQMKRCQRGILICTNGTSNLERA
nr:uncharacterized protein LOC112782468 [Arachis hypogaea]